MSLAVGSRPSLGRRRPNAGFTAAGATVAALILAACAEPVADRDRPVTERPTLYACDDGTLAAAVFVDGRDPAVLLSVGGAPAQRLPQVEAASGARFGDGSTLFWVQGAEAMLETPGGARTTCTVQNGAGGS